MSPILDRFRHLLLRQEVHIGNLSASDLGLIIVAAGLAIPKELSSSEKEVTERLDQWLATVGTNIQADAVEMRRYLVDYRCLERDPAGKVYTRPSAWPTRWQELAAELAPFDLASFAAQVRLEEIERRAARKAEVLRKRDER